MEIKKEKKISLMNKVFGRFFKMKTLSMTSGSRLNEPVSTFLRNIICIMTVFVPMLLFF